MIDTQVFVWLTNGDNRLGAKTLQVLQDISNQLYMSYFSFFEMTIKASVGKLDYDNSILEDLPKMGIELIMPDLSALKEYRIFNPGNKDPFDNVLISTAISEGHTLITSDPKILSVATPNLSLIDATK